MIKNRKWNRFYTDVLLLSAGDFLFAIGSSLYSSFVPIYIKEIGGNELVISITIALPFIFSILAIPAGILCDLINRKILIVFGWFITAPAPLIWYFTDNWKWFLAGKFIFCFTTIVTPAVAIYIFNYKTSSSKMQAYSLQGISGIIGLIAATTAGGIIIAKFGMKSVFVMVFFIYLASSVIVLFISGQKPEDKIRIKETFRLKMFRQEYNLKNISLFIIMLNIIVFALNIAEPFIAIYLKTEKGLAIEIIGICFVLSYIGSTFFTWLYGKTHGVLTLPLVCGLGLIVFVTGIILLLLTKNVFIIVIAMFLTGINRSIELFLRGYFSNIITGTKKGLIISLFICIQGLIKGIAMLCGTPLYKSLPDSVFYTEIFFVLTSFLCLIITGFYRKTSSNEDVGFLLLKN